MSPGPYPARSLPADVANPTGTGTGTSRRRAVPGGGSVPMERVKPQNSAIEIPVPWLVPPEGSSEININASLAGFNAANTPAVIPGSQFALPENHVGVLRSVVVSVNTMVITSALVWRIIENGNPIQGWNNITIFPRAAASVSVAFSPDETFIRLSTGAELSVEIVVLPADPLTYQAGVSYHGWSYPVSVADRFANLYSSMR